MVSEPGTKIYYIVHLLVTSSVNLVGATFGRKKVQRILLSSKPHPLSRFSLFLCSNIHWFMVMFILNPDLGLTILLTEKQFFAVCNIPTFVCYFLSSSNFLS